MEELRPWIDRRLRALDAVDAELERGRAPNTVAFLGTDLTLVPQAGRTRVHRRGDLLLVPATDGTAALERWYRRQARTVIAAKLDAATARAGLTYTGLTIRGQRTRWASCSSAGAMSFNWRLLLAPEAVLDYVVEHEVCHLTHMDHGPGFRALMAERVPDHAQHSRWLRRYGSALTLAPERAAQRRVIALPALDLDQPAPEAAGVGLHGAVAADVDSARRSARAAHLHARLHLHDRVVGAPRHLDGGPPRAVGKGACVLLQSIQGGAGVRKGPFLDTSVNAHGQAPRHRL